MVLPVIESITRQEFIEEPEEEFEPDNPHDAQESKGQGGKCPCAAT